MENIELKLIQDSWITEEQFNIARQEAENYNKSIWTSLVKMGFMSEEDVVLFLTQESGINYVRISDYKIKPEIIKLLSEDFCRLNLVIPLFRIKDTLFVACSNPFNTALIDNISKLAGCSVEPLAATSDSITKALNSYLGLEDKLFEWEKLIYKQQPLQGINFWRESERLELNMPVSIKLDDESVVLKHSTPLTGYTRNISNNGTAIDLRVFLFLPKGLNLDLTFMPDKQQEGDKIITAKGNAVYCQMAKGQHYLLGVKFKSLEEETRRQLFKFATPLK